MRRTRSPCQQVMPEVRDIMRRIADDPEIRYQTNGSVWSQENDNKRIPELHALEICVLLGAKCIIPRGATPEDWRLGRSSIADAIRISSILTRYITTVESYRNIHNALKAGTTAAVDHRPDRHADMLTFMTMCHLDPETTLGHAVGPSIRVGWDLAPRRHVNNLSRSEQSYVHAWALALQHHAKAGHVEDIAAAVHNYAVDGGRQNPNSRDERLLTAAIEQVRSMSPADGAFIDSIFMDMKPSRNTPAMITRIRANTTVNDGSTAPWRNGICAGSIRAQQRRMERDPGCVAELIHADLMIQEHDDVSLLLGGCMHGILQAGRTGNQALTQAVEHGLRGYAGTEPQRRLAAAAMLIAHTADAPHLDDLVAATILAHEPKCLGKVCSESNRAATLRGDPIYRILGGYAQRGHRDAVIAFCASCDAVSDMAITGLFGGYGTALASSMRTACDTPVTAMRNLRRIVDHAPNDHIHEAVTHDRAFAYMVYRLCDVAGTTALGVSGPSQDAMPDNLSDKQMDIVLHASIDRCTAADRARLAAVAIAVTMDDATTNDDRSSAQRMIAALAEHTDTTKATV